VRLTRWGTGQASWSPGGRYVAFERYAGRDRNGDGTTKIAVADARGRVRWTFGDGLNNSDPLWSPDGRHILFFSSFAHSGGYSVARPNGSDDHGVFGCTLTGTVVFHCPRAFAWAADSEHLAFEDRDDQTGDVSIFSVRADGSDRHVLVPRAGQPAYSPDGTKLAYVGWTGIVVANPDGSNPKTIVGSSWVAWPRWSSNGTRIAFERIVDSGLGEIVVVDSDGGGEHMVGANALTPATEPVFAWSPKGNLIAFRRGPQKLVVAPAAGGGETEVVSRVDPTYVTPAWRPAVALPPAQRGSCPRK
jgi:Tol biopolymer transport system component